MGSSAGSDSGGGGGRDTDFQQRGMSKADYAASKQEQNFSARDNDNNNYPDRIQRISTGIEPGFRPQDEQPFGLSKEEAFRQGRITKDQLEAPAVLESQVVDDRTSLEKGVDSIIDFYKQGGFLGAVVRGLEPASKAIQKKAMDFGLTTKIINETYKNCHKR